MQFCQPHYDALREAIKDRGLWPLVAPTSEAAKERFEQEVEQLQGGPPPDDKTWDPLMAAVWAIYGRAIECGGLYLMHGDYCPLCELDRHAPADVPIPAGYDTHSAAWIGGCCDARLADAREKGLVPKTQ